MAAKPPHVPVMPAEVLAWLAVTPQGRYVDCTAGAGGHARLIAERLEGGRLLALDRDPSAVAMARERLAAFAAAEVRQANYGRLGEVLRDLDWPPVDGVLIDAGVSSMQLDQPERGFSFQAAGPLDMRMGPDAAPASDILREIDEAALAGLLRKLGDVGPARRVARAIVRRARENQLNTTEDLRAAVEEALDFVKGTPEEIRTVFQAVRMAVNEELLWLERGLQSAIDVLAPGGRLVVIAFHSGEDRVVKQVLRAASRRQRVLRADGRVEAVHPARLKLLTPRPVTPSAEESAVNPRSKSAKLRAAERLPEE